MQNLEYVLFHSQIGTIRTTIEINKLVTGVLKAVAGVLDAMGVGPIGKGHLVKLH